MGEGTGVTAVGDNPCPGKGVVGDLVMSVESGVL